MPQRRKRLASNSVAQLRLVAEGKQRLLAARPRTRARDRENMLWCQIGRNAPLGRAREGAVVADITA